MTNWLMDGLLTVTDRWLTVADGLAHWLTVADGLMCAKCVYERA